MRDRLRLAVLALAPVAGLGAAALWQPPPLYFAAAVAAYAVAHLVAVPTRTGRHVTFAPAVVATIAFLFGGSPVMVLGAAAVAMPVGWLIVHVRFGRRAADDVFPGEPAGLVAYGIAVGFGATGLAEPAYRDPFTVVVFGLAAVAWFTASAVTRALASEQGRAGVRSVVASQAVEDWPTYAALFSTAALFAMTVGVMGVWSVPLAGLPYLFGHVSLARARDTDQTYRETMLALSRIPEAGGLVPSGHAERCAEMSVALGAELGLWGHSLRRIEAAALLHDIGRVVLANPVIASKDYGPEDVAGWSSVIIGEAGYLERVAAIVAAQHQPYRRPGESRDESLPEGASVLRAIAAYDGKVDRGVSPAEALEHLHRGAAYDFDPEVVAALRRVLQRNGVINA